MRITEVALSGTVGTRLMGPVSNVIFELSNRFVARGHDVVLVDFPAIEPRTLLRPDVRVLEVDGKPGGRVAMRSRNYIPSTLKRWSNQVRCVRQFYRCLDSSRTDVVHFHSPEPAFVAQRMYGIDSSFYTAHTPNWALVPPPGGSPIGQVLMWLERDVIRRSRISVGLGSYLSKAVPGANVVTIANGLDVEAWPLLDRAEAREALGIGERQFVVLFTGQIRRVKGVDVLLEAIRQVAPSLPNLCVHALGSLSGSFDRRDAYVNPYAKQMLEMAQGLPVEFLSVSSTTAN